MEGFNLKKISMFVFLSFIFFIAGCSSYSKYPDEIKRAYHYVDQKSQKTIKNWKNAKVEEYKPTEELSIIDKKGGKYRLVNIKGIKTLKITFETTEDPFLGPIVVFIDKNSKKILGIGGRE